MAEMGQMLASMVQTSTTVGTGPWTATVTPASKGIPWGDIGTGLQVGGKVSEGIAAKKAGEFEADQYRQKAAEERAVASRSAYEKRLDRDRLISRQVAVAASGGAGVNNASIMDIIGDTAARGQYLIDTEIAGGESRSRGQMNKANAAKAKGSNALIGTIFDAGTTLAKGVYKAKYG